MSTGLRYRAFKQEMKSLAGYHTGENLVLDEDYMNEAAIQLHEAAHDHIFTDTLDGKLHKHVMLCLRENIYPEDVHLLTSINEFLFENTKLSHERAATFLGVIGLPDRTAILNAKAMLNEEYSDYFAYFSDFLPWLNASFVSYIIAFAMARFAFNSARMSKISDLNTLTVENLQSVEGPEQRMDAAKRGFIEGDCNSPEFIEVIFSAIFQSHSIESYDIFDDSAWEARIYSGVTDTSVIERVGCFAFESLFSTISGLKVHCQAPTPSCFESIKDLILHRDFDIEFPLIDGHYRSLPENAALYFSKEADKNAVSRRKFIEIPEFSIDYSFNLIASHIEKELCIVFVQIRGQPKQFKMFSTIIYEGESSFLPGSGLVVDINAIIFLATQLGDLIVKHNLHSPLFYMIYAPGAPDESGTPIIIPKFEEQNAKLFINHLAVNKEPAAGQGLLLRPMVYGRPFWTYAIENTIGEHRDYSVKMLDFDGENNTVEYCAQVLIPVTSGGFPALAILDTKSMVAYDSYIRLKVEQGNLESHKMTSITRGMSEILSAVWQTLPVI